MSVVEDFKFWVTRMLGKPQVWYDQVSALQKAWSIFSAEVGGIGKEKWDAITSAEIQAAILSQRQPPYLWFYDQVVGSITKHLRNLTITEGHSPSDAEVAAAGAEMTAMRTGIDFIKSKVPPSVQKQSEDNKIWMENQLRNYGLRSPAEAGIDGFIRGLEQQMRIIGDALTKIITETPWGLIAGAGIAIAVAIALKR